MSGRATQPAVRRFFHHVVIGPPGKCWLWLGNANKKGYGKFYYKGRKVYAHRFSWAIVNGEPSDGLVSDHLCRNHSCVNPDHIEMVSQSVNVLRGNSPIVSSTRNRNGDHCRNGHLLSTAGTVYRGPKYGHCCRQCVRLRDVRAKRKHRALNRNCGNGS